MCAAIDNKTTGLQKIFNIFSRSKPSSLNRKSSNQNENDKLATDAIAIRRSSLQLQPRPIQNNPSLSMNLMSSPNLALHSQQFTNGEAGNLQNFYHITGAEAVHIGNSIQIIQNTSRQVMNESPAIGAGSNPSNENGITVEKPKRFSVEQKRMIDKLKRSTIEINEKIINIAADNISPKNANFIYRYLGISDAKIDMIEKDNFVLHGAREVTYKMLLHWKQSADNPTIGLLITALYKNKNDQCIEKLICHFIDDGTF